MFNRNSVISYPFYFLLFISVTVLSDAQRLRTGAIHQQYQQLCASCHGQELEGGLGGALIKDTWKHGRSDEELAKVIREGVPDAGMPGFEAGMSEKDIRSMVIYIRERQTAASMSNTHETISSEGEKVYQSDIKRFRLETVAQ